MEISRGEVLSIENGSVSSVSWCMLVRSKHGSPVKATAAAAFFLSVVYHTVSTFPFIFLPSKKTNKAQLRKGLFMLIFSRLLITDS